MLHLFRYLQADRLVHSFQGFSSRLLFSCAILLLILGLSERLSAQTCDPEADFNITVNGCSVDFQSLFSGPGTAVHEWSFFNSDQSTGDHSISDVPNPRYTFQVTAN